MVALSGDLSCAKGCRRRNDFTAALDQSGRTGHGTPASELSNGIGRVLVIDGDEVASARLTAELGPLLQVVSAVVSVQQALNWLGARTIDAIVLCATASMES